MAGTEYEIFKLGDWELQSGEKLLDAHIAYKTFGDPSSPAIVYPTWYTGFLSDNFWLIGDEKFLSPKKYFIIIPALFGNSQSTSPSNQKHSGPFPACSFYDNVRAQYKLVTEHFGIKHLRAVIGWSMGAAQTFQWACQFPDFMDLAIPFCGSARTSLHNQTMLEGVKSVLLAPKLISSAGPAKLGLMKAGETVRTWTTAETEVSLKAFARVYAGWGFSQTFYREKLYESVLGFKDLEDFMQNFWEKWGLSKDPENLLTMLQTWQTGDISKQPLYNGDLEKALASIKAKTLVMPGKTDLYFPPEDSEYEVSCMKPGVGDLRVFPSVWGHWAGGPGGSADDVKWLDEQLAEFFEKN